MDDVVKWTAEAHAIVSTYMSMADDSDKASDPGQDAGLRVSQLPPPCPDRSVLLATLST
jgi:hypothetical protein